MSQYDSVYSNYKVILKIALIWFIGFGVLILPASGVWGEFRLDETKHGCEWVGDSSKMFFTVLFTLLPMVIMIYCYSMIFLKIRRVKKDLNQLNINGNREDREVLKMMFTLFICFLVCMIPISVIKIIDPLVLKRRLHIIPNLIFTCQAIVNPFVYAFKNSTYKPAFVDLYSKNCFYLKFVNLSTTETAQTGETQT